MLSIRVKVLSFQNRLDGRRETKMVLGGYRWLFQFSDVPTRLNFYRNRRCLPRRCLVADHFVRDKVTGLCFWKRLRISWFFSIMLFFLLSLFIFPQWFTAFLYSVLLAFFSLFTLPVYSVYHLKMKYVLQRKRKSKKKAVIAIFLHSHI